uniref:cytosolic phospholipase A2 gamma-like isoform X2 n=1 Tax=Semicossyphus pulcher TaxID=241346 RepID=UPI0037E6FE24
MIKRCNMKTGKRFSISLIWFWIVILVALASAEDDMEGQTAASEKSIRHSQSVCDGEQEYVEKRKQIILESLNSLGINCSADSVPHIALLASGGGQRAAVGVMGSLYQMEKDDLLDSVLYLGGISGSTWSMSSLYSDPKWSVDMDRAVSKLMNTEVDLEEVHAWLANRSKEEHFSLTDIWGVLTSAAVMKQMDLRRLSEEASRNATNPYPIYCAIEKVCFSQGHTEGKWFEFSPHEAGFTELGLFVETSLLGSKFQSGELLEEKPEMDMVKLQGLLSSALAEGETNKEYISHWLQLPGVENTTASQPDDENTTASLPDVVDAAASQPDDENTAASLPSVVDVAASLPSVVGVAASLPSVAAVKEYLRVYKALGKVVALTRGIFKDPSALSDLDKLQKLLEDADIIHHNESTGQAESNSLEEKQSYFQQLSQRLVGVVDTWSQSLPEGSLKRHVSVLTAQVLPLIVKWEWGTLNNFLYQYQNSSDSPCIYTTENLHLEDAGLLMNVPYPSFLGDKRDIDLIIAPDYSAGEIFETLTLARDYAAELKKPFPKIDEKILEEREWPKDCYVFEGKDKEPTIVYLPLFNRDNCKDAEEVKEKMSEFSTFQLSFSQENIEFLLETAKENMKRNKETLLREINKAALRRCER